MDTIEYVKLNPSTLEPDEFGIYYKVITQQNGAVIKQAFNETKTETQRINNNTIVDVVYAFDFESEEYIEQSRIERTDVIIQSVDEIAELKAKNVESEQLLADLILTLVERGVL